MSLNAQTPDNPQVFTVSAIVKEMKSLLESHFPHIWVEGEITNLSRPRSGHVYFSLKDENAELPAVMFASAASRLGFELQNGERIQCSGRITVYERQGKVQINVLRARPVGAGHLLAAFEALKKRLHAEGIFDEEHKKFLPVIPRRVGIVTSPTGAAIRDMLRVIHDRFPIPVLLVPTAVQGVEAPRQIIAGIQALDAEEDVDVIIIGRGGGSIEDLWAFNNENLARAIFQASTPVISAVGHETDFLLSDMVADLRAATPTHAAELVVPIRAEISASFQQMRHQLARSMKLRFSQARQRLGSLQPRDPSQILEQRMMRLDEMTTAMETSLRYQILTERRRMDGLENRLRILHPAHRLKLYRRKTADLHHRLIISTKQKLGQSQQGLGFLQAQLSALGPTGILERGYAIIRQTDSGRLVKSTDGVSLGDPLRLTVVNGDINVDVTGVSAHDKPENTGG